MTHLSILRYKFSQNIILFFHLCAKRCEAELRKLESLNTNRNSNDGYATQKRCKKLHKKHLPAKEKYPYRISYRMLHVRQLNLFSERCKCKLCKLKALNSKGYSNNGYTEQQSRQYPEKCRNKPSENYPDNISNKLHVTYLALRHRGVVGSFLGDVDVVRM